MPVRKRSVSIAGHATSFSLEDEFWLALQALADDEGLPLAGLVRRVDAERARDSNLSSALRLYVLEAAKQGRLTS